MRILFCAWCRHEGRLRYKQRFVESYPSRSFPGVELLIVVRRNGTLYECLPRAFVSVPTVKVVKAPSRRSAVSRPCDSLRERSTLRSQSRQSVEVDRPRALAAGASAARLLIAIQQPVDNGPRIVSLTRWSHRGFRHIGRPRQFLRLDLGRGCGWRTHRNQLHRRWRYNCRLDCGRSAGPGTKNTCCRRGQRSGKQHTDDDSIDLHGDHSSHLRPRLPFPVDDGTV